MQQPKSLQQHLKKILTKKCVDTEQHHESECPGLLCVSELFHNWVRWKLHEKSIQHLLQALMHIASIEISMG